MTGSFKPFSLDSNIEIKRLEAALTAAKIGTWELNRTNNQFLVCERFQSIFGHTLDNVTSFDKVLEYIHPDDHGWINEEIEKALLPNNTASFDIEFCIEKSGEQPRWINFKGQNHFNDDGHPYRLSGIILDITQNVVSRQELETKSEQLRKHKKDLQNLVENIPDVITRWDKDLKLTFANPAFETKTGMSLNDALGKTNQEMMGRPADNPGPYMEMLKGVLDTGEPKYHYSTFVTPDEKIAFFSQVVPEFDSAGDVESILAIARDITELKNSESRFKTMFEQAPMAIGLLSGPDMIVEAGNDRILEVWGRDKSIIGIPLTVALPEIQNQVYLQLLQKVYDTGVPYMGNALLAQIERKDGLKDVYFDFVYTPMRDNSGAVTGIMVMATEVTQQVNDRKNLEASEAKFRLLIEQAPVATCLFTGKDMTVELVNELMINYWGKDVSVLGKPLREAVPELAGQPFLGILDNILITGEAYSSKNAAVEFVINGVPETYYFDYIYKPIFNDQNEVFGIINMSIDVTAQVLSQKALEASEAKLRSVVANAPAAIGLFVGRDLVVEMPNQAFIDIVGKGPEIDGKPLREVMPELESQAYLQILDDVYTSGKMYQSFGTRVDILQQGVMTHNYYNITYSPLFDENGNVYAILDIAIDVTEKMAEQKQIEESQLQLLALFEQSPVAIAIISEQELTFTMANPFYAELVGRPLQEIVGKPMLDALPELAGQGFDDLLRTVIATGIPFISKEQAANVLHNGQMETIYVDLNYQPKKEADNKVSGVFVVATDITAQVLARQKLAEGEITLRGAIELAELGTWQIDLKTGELDFSTRLKEWFGMDKDEAVTIEKIYEPIRETDLPGVKQAITTAITTGTNAIYDIEFTLDASPARKERILHALGLAVYNENGIAIKVNGNVQDVTAQRKIQLALEQQVQERTEELEAINEELAAINEEYIATNEELAQSNELLIRSNQNLQQFAYVASHDLQEPLRKIQSFGDLLRNRFAQELGSGVEYLERMQSAARRMSALIEDLLAFSRVSSDQWNAESVEISNVVKNVLSDLELVINQTGAIITAGHLPTLKGDEIQLGQLFQNLISNAIKFRKTNITPTVHLTSKIISASELPDSVIPVRPASAYDQIDVTDNGIGFDTKHVHRIFQIFQRLHGRAEYAGTGIGLAICEKVVVNHGGAITASSSPGKGSTFTVYLPI